jgi:hypothetical protein
MAIHLGRGQSTIFPMNSGIMLKLRMDCGKSSHLAYNVNIEFESWPLIQSKQMVKMPTLYDFILSSY